MENNVQCPDCGRTTLIVTTQAVPLVITKLPNLDAGGFAGIGDPWGSSFPISLNAEVVCNSASCQWEGTLRELAER